MIRALEIHDVDNRLKDILDALQGRAGGSQAIRKLQPIILNDRQIYYVTITKSVPPKKSLGLGHVAVWYLAAIPATLPTLVIAGISCKRAAPTAKPLSRLEQLRQQNAK